MTPMDVPEPSKPAAARPADQPTDRAVLEFLAWRYDRLHTLFQFALAGLIILSAAIDVFLYKQMRLMRVQLPPQRDATIRYAMDFHKRDDVTIRSFVARLQQFATTNADFQPILDQYRTTLGGYYLPTPQKVAPALPPAKTNAAKK
ncbi:MAG TPA: hypothetical protein VJ063_20660 [Verrucomicrobiae bacterium]|nr:hypothetical protein [Verrucomicrobiae bacterium]